MSSSAGRPPAASCPRCVRGPRFSAPSPTRTARLFGSHHPRGCRVAPHGAFNSFEPNCCKLV